MLAKKEFLARFGLLDMPVFVPQERACWLIDDDVAVPTEWTIRQPELTDEAWAVWESVLHQPETKKVQRLFLKHLARPETVWELTLEEGENQRLLPIYLNRPQVSEALALRIRIPAHTHARIVFIEKAVERGETDGALRANLTLAADVGENASLEISYIHPFYEAEASGGYLHKADFKTCLYRADVAAGGSFRWTSVNLGDSLIQKGEVYLNGERASADIGGASYIQSGAEQLYQGHVFCRVPHGYCRIHNHGVVENGGSGSLISISDITKGAHGTEAREEDRFMTLGDEAKAFADPTLLIDEYDVKASHAATVGQVNEEQLFYMQSRGLDRRRASRLMTAGFLTPLFDRITLEELRNVLLEQFYEKMHLDEMLGEDSLE